MADLNLQKDDGAVDVTRPTNSDLSSLQYHVVKLDSSEEVVQSTANDKSLGFLQNSPDGSSNEKSAHVRVQGVSLGVLAESVSFGDFLTPDSNGELEVADASNEEVIAKALTSGDSGDEISVLMTHVKDTDGNG